jgi:circadian clock protein KaiC
MQELQCSGFFRCEEMTMTQRPPLRQRELISTGMPGLNDILRGGFYPNRIYLVEGSPGTGKTTLAMQFLMAGRDRGENVLYITLSETAEELLTVGETHGWNMEGIELFELVDAEDLLNAEQEITVLHPWEVELGETVQRIIKRVEEVNPSRVVFDSMSELRLLAQDPLRYRRQILALKRFFTERNCTVLLLDDKVNVNGINDEQLHSLTHGVINLDRFTLEFGVARRRLEVLKMRGVGFHAGWHDLTIKQGGMIVYPRLVASEHSMSFADEAVPSGLPEMDALLDGGPLRGTTSLIVGPAGSGKTTLALQYAVTAAKRGECVAIYEFDERMGTLITRARKLGLDLEPLIEQGLINIRQVDPSELAPGEFSDMVKQEVESNNTRMVIIDSLNGYLAAMPEEKQLLLQIHELLTYMNHKGVLSFLINPQEGMVGSMATSTMSISYIADTVVLFRFFEAFGRIRKALSIIKNRGGGHENSIREFMIGRNGIRIGEPLAEFQGIFMGTPFYTGAKEDLMPHRDGGH